MFPEKSKETQLVARVARRIIASNMDIPSIKTIKWTVRVIVSDYYFENLYYVLHFINRIPIWKMVSCCYKKKIDD